MSNSFILFHIIVPNPDVSVQITPNSELNNRNFESGMVSLGCLVIITSLDVDTNVNITWFGPNGVVVHDNIRYIIDTCQLNSTVYGSSLNITDLSLTGDNGTQYYCKAQVGANDSFVFSSFVISPKATFDNVTVIVEGTCVTLLNTVTYILSLVAIPLPSVEIFDMGTPIVDGIFTLTCNATVPDNLVGLAIVKVKWVYNETLRDNVALIYKGDNSATLIFSPVSQTQEGLYTCIATITIPGIPLQRNTSRNYTFSRLGKVWYKNLVINIIVCTYIGNPIVSITTSGYNIAGNMYSLLCSVSVVFGTPDITWFYSNGTKLLNDSEITQTLTMISDTIQTYELPFNPLMYTHVGEYTCVANLTVICDNATFIGVNNATTTVYVTSKFNIVTIFNFYLLYFLHQYQPQLSL